MRHKPSARTNRAFPTRRCSISFASIRFSFSSGTKESNPQTSRTPTPADSLSGSRGGYPPRPALKESAGVGVREVCGFDSFVPELNENRMLANDIEQRRVGKALFVRADGLWRIYSGKDCRLA